MKINQAIGVQGYLEPDLLFDSGARHWEIVEVKKMQSMLDIAYRNVLKTKEQRINNLID